jgi:hypothetical protein
MYMQVGDFRVSRRPATVPLMQILRNAVFLKSQNPRNAGTLCKLSFPLAKMQVNVFITEL